MKNDDKILCYSRRLLFFMVLVLVGSAFNSCKSSRNVVEETITEFHHTGEDCARDDSVLMRGNDRSGETDTTSVSTDVHGKVEITRDSAGRPIIINWMRSFLFSTLSKSEKETLWNFSGLNASRHSASSDSVDSVNEKKEETTQEIDTEISLENIIGPGLLCLIALYLIYLFFVDIMLPWIKQFLNR